MIEGRHERNDADSTPLVYLVDDDGEFREEMVHGLSRFGIIYMDLIVLHLCIEYMKRPASIVILDIGLKEEDGLYIAAHLRKSQSVEIIMATARGSVDDRIEGLKTGADAYFLKPIDVRELAATVLALNDRLNTLHFFIICCFHMGLGGRGLGHYRWSRASTTPDNIRTTYIGALVSRPWRYR